MSESKVILTGYRDLKNKISGESSSTFRETIKNKFGDTVEFGYKYCPDLASNPDAINGAKGIAAAEKQNKSEEFYQLIAGSEDFSREYVFEVARKLEIEMDSFQRDFDDEGVEARIYRDIEDSKSSGLLVFPGLTIDGIPYNGAWDDHSVFEAIKKRGRQQVSRAIDSFFHWGASAAAVLILATLAALIMVNVGFEEVYEHWRHLKSGLTFGESSLILPLEIWINDFLMAIFFLMIGLEIKKEVLDGELSDMKRAAMPVIGAIGGMLVPSLLYAVFNVSVPESANGWGIPMATDIAFTLGLMALLGSRVPISLKIFISALAVADDLGAIIVIALFYGHGFHLMPFIGALAVIATMAILNNRKVFSLYIYLGLGLLLWFLIFESGLHATLAGVITAILIPTRGRADLPLIARQTAIIFDREVNKSNGEGDQNGHISHGSLNVLKSAVDRLREPSDYLLHSLEKVVNFFILPLFAFFNTGIALTHAQIDFTSASSLGIIVGLVIGKPLGIVGACWVASKAKIAQLSGEINWSLLFGAACLAGVGFTMSIVVASSAFHGAMLTSSKVSILVASTISALLGLFILNAVTKKQA
ncbi:Na+/H+ antiporter NhaA [Reichenbachiella versicolor]|uniref:Na+/H+ antiporter NhaA n=1 Tax=Reichenbachiella versicolor TaxID=1821036 RepID=UPI000D6E0533|nr:Na+/H+ antiporter NhaA [Reichenbachiella versicolor]